MKQLSKYLFVILFCVSSISSAQDTMGWSQSYHKLVSSGMLEVELDSNPSTGYDWYLINSEAQFSNFLQFKEKEFLAGPSQGPAVGVPGKTRFLFQAKAPIDSLVLLFAYRRAWEPEVAAAQHLATVTIIEAKARRVCHPVCRNVGTRSEGWYSSCTQELITYESCASLTEPYCGALKTRSEGWYSDRGLIQYARCFDGRFRLPQCINIGQESEGWTVGNHFVKATCQGSKIVCAHPLSKSEGFWATREGQGLTLVDWSLCMNESKE